MQVASDLLGKLLVRKLPDNSCLAGIVVEVEAYLFDNDPACHAARGQTRRNATMFAEAGHLYVYSIHSRHCLNIVTERVGLGAAVLIRAIEPWIGIERMATNRGLPAADSIKPDFLPRLSSGPGRVCEALAVNRQQDGLDLVKGQEIWLENPVDTVITSTWSEKVDARIGLSQGKDLQLRWFMDGHRLVSGPASAHSHGRWWQFSHSRETKEARSPRRIT